MSSPSRREEVAEILGGYQCPKCGTREFSTLVIESPEHQRYWWCNACLFQETSRSDRELVLGENVLREGGD